MLIGFALIAVIAGIIATLITGGSLFPFSPSQRSDTPLISSPNEPLSGPTVAGSLPAATEETVSGAAVDGTESQEPVIAVLPPVERAPVAAVVGTSGTARTGNSSVAAAASSPSSGSASPVPSQGAVELPGYVADGPFRVSVGAFGKLENAETQATRFRDAGYPVFVVKQGKLSLVLVGPFASEGDAAAAADRIRGEGFGIDPIVYRFKPSQAPQAETTETATAAGVATAAETAPVSSGGRYLQVGAYATVKSSLPQRQRLESLGFSVTQRTESGLVKLLIGPFGAGDLATVQAQLKAQGIDNFPR